MSSTTTKMIYGGFIVICVSLWSSNPLHAALLVNEYDSQRHDRFSNSSSFIGSSYDWSGIGRNSSGQWGTLISDRHFVTANHFAPASDSVLRFYATNDPNGNYAEQRVISTQSIGGSDLAVGELSEPVFHGAAFDINYYPLLPDASELPGTELFVVGQSSDPLTANTRVGRNEVTGVIPNFSTSGRTGDIFFYDYDTGANGVGADESRVAGGDSGAPSLAVVNGQLTLVGVHWFVYGNTASTTGGSGSGDTLISSYIEELAAATGQSTASFAVSSIPEPTCVLPLLLVFGFARTRRVRRCRN